MFFCTFFLELMKSQAQDFALNLLAVKHIHHDFLQELDSCSTHEGKRDLTECML